MIKLIAITLTITAALLTTSFACDGSGKKDETKKTPGQELVGRSVRL